MTISKILEKNDKEKVLSGVFRNIKRDDLWIKRDLMIDYFKKHFSFNGVCKFCK